MPELPEVETLTRDIDAVFTGRRLTRIEILDPSVLGQTDFGTKSLKNARLRQISRRGKYIVYDFGSRFLIQHLRMTGQMLPLSSTKLPQLEMRGPQNMKFRATFHFSGLEPYVFYDVRRFGTIDFTNDSLGYFEMRKLAPDMFNTPSEAEALYRQKLAKANRPIKSALLDQSICCGVGNIYADEALHGARLHPLRAAQTLTRTHQTRLFSALQSVMRSAIAKRGTSMSDYLDVNGQPGAFARYLYVYGRAGEYCKSCKQGKIEVLQIAGRSSHFCPKCQKIGPSSRRH